MSKLKAVQEIIDPKEKKNDSDELFQNDEIYKPDEIDSDGSASAFDETEQVNEDNFDHLSEK